MLKKILLFLLSINLCHAAETCPTPIQLQNNIFNNWKIFDIDNGSPLSSKKLEQFIKHIDHFALAEWQEEAPEGEAHCYYESTHADKTYLGAFLARHSLGVDKTNVAWHAVGYGNMQCADDIVQCRFIE